MFLGQQQVGMALARSSGAADAPGAVRTVTDASGNVGWQMRLFKPTGAALTAGQVLAVTYQNGVSGCPAVGAVASGTFANDQVVVATAATVSGTWDWYYFRGYCQILVEGTTDVAANDYLKSVAGTSTTALIKDSSTVRGVSSVAVAKAAQTANSEVLTLCWLIGYPATLV